MIYVHSMRLEPACILYLDGIINNAPLFELKFSQKNGFYLQIVGSGNLWKGKKPDVITFHSLDGQVPLLPTTIMSLYGTFKGMVPGRLIVFGIMLRTAWTLALKVVSASANLPS